MSLTVSLRQEQDLLGIVIVVEGEIDLQTAPRLHQELLDQVNAGHRHLVVDLQAVDFLDSTALSVLIAAAKRVRPDGGSVQIVATNPAVLKIFRVTGLVKVFPIHATVPEAVAAVS